MISLQRYGIYALLPKKIPLQALQKDKVFLFPEKIEEDNGVCCVRASAFNGYAH